MQNKQAREANPSTTHPSSPKPTLQDPRPRAEQEGCNQPLLREQTVHKLRASSLPCELLSTHHPEPLLPAWQQLILIQKGTRCNPS